MSDEGCGAFVLVMLLALAVIAAFLAHGAGRRDGYRRGFCEGRGGVEATVGDSIRCIRPPVAVDTVRGR